MAKIEGTQTIPSSVLIPYRGSLTESMANNVVRSRYPYRVKKMQLNGRGVSQAQKDQRARFLEAQALFQTITPAQKARWYDAMPRWHSLLWYYNFFMLSALNGVLGAVVSGAAVIKQIQNISIVISQTTLAVTIPTAIDPAKCLVFLFGQGNEEYFLSYSGGERLVMVGNPPAFSGLNSSRLTVFGAIPYLSQPSLTVSIVEYI